MASSLCLTGAAASTLLKTNGQPFLVSSIEKSALSSTQPVLTSPTDQSLQIVTGKGSRIVFATAAYGSYASSALLLCCQELGTFEFVGADHQPIQLIAIEAQNLTP